MSLEVHLAPTDPAEPIGWTVDAHGLRWTGPADAGEGAPALTLTLARSDESAPFLAAIEAGDAAGIEPLVSEVALPDGLLGELARHCLQQQAETALPMAEGRRFTELRWARALAEQAIACSLASGVCALEECENVLAFPAGFSMGGLLALDDGAFVVHWRDHQAPIEQHEIDLHRGGETTRLATLETGEHDTVAIVPPAHGRPGNFALAGHRQARALASLWIFEASGRLARSGHTQLASAPEAWSEATALGWLHAHEHHVAFPLAPAASDPGVRPAWPADAAPPVRLEARPRDSDELLARLCVLDGFLLTFRGLRERAEVQCDELRWIDLDGTREDRAIPWFQEVRSVEPASGLVWVLTSKGAWGLHPLRESRFRWGHGPSAVQHEGDQLWLSFYNYLRREQGVLAIDLPTSGEPWRVLLPERPAHLRRVPGGVIACGEAWVWIRDDGSTLAQRPGFQRLESLTLGDATVIAAGRDLLFLDGAGALVRHVPLACPAELLGAAGGRAAIQPEDSRHEPAGIWLFDAGGRMVARIPVLTLDAGRQAFYLRSDRLLRFTPRVSATATHSVFPPARHLQRSEVLHHKYDAGLLVMRASYLGIENEYLGDDGQPAVQASDGAVVTLVRCKLREGSIELYRGSTAILIDCEEESPDDATIYDDSFVVRVTSR